MGKNIQKQKRGCIVFMSILACIALIIPICTGLAEESSIMIIDLHPTIVSSGENFSVSVYDPTIHNGTPYLVDVTIEFNGDYYEITDESPGAELILTAPLVTTKKTYLIASFFGIFCMLRMGILL